MLRLPWSLSADWSSGFSIQYREENRFWIIATARERLPAAFMVDAVNAFASGKPIASIWSELAKERWVCAHEGDRYVIRRLGADQDDWALAAFNASDDAALMVRAVRAFRARR